MAYENLNLEPEEVLDAEGNPVLVESQDSVHPPPAIRMRLGGDTVIATTQEELELAEELVSNGMAEWTSLVPEAGAEKEASDRTASGLMTTVAPLSTLVGVDIMGVSEDSKLFNTIRGGEVLLTLAAPKIFRPLLKKLPKVLGSASGSRFLDDVAGLVSGRSSVSVGKKPVANVEGYKAALETAKKESESRELAMKEIQRERKSIASLKDAEAQFESTLGYNSSTVKESINPVTGMRATLRMLPSTQGVQEILGQMEWAKSRMKSLGLSEDEYDNVVSIVEKAMSEGADERIRKSFMKAVDDILDPGIVDRLKKEGISVVKYLADAAEGLVVTNAVRKATNDARNSDGLLDDLKSDASEIQQKASQVFSQPDAPKTRKAPPGARL
jgi:hypothetical protein